MIMEEERMQKLRKRQLLLFHEIPAWQRDNEYLLSGYRRTSGSLLLSLKSSFSWHNETVNIQSHLFGSAVFVLLPLHFYFTLYQKVASAQPSDAILIMFYFLGVSICFACSSSCHIMWNHSSPIAALGNRLDFCAIVLLMWSASLPSIHFGFICQPTLQNLHWSLVTASASGCVFFTLHPRFIKPTFRTYRAIMYTCFGLSAITFILHSIFINGLDMQKKRLGLEWMALMAMLNILGAAMYSLQLPERLFPYRFDLVGASHQILHVLVFVAGIVHYKALACAFLEVRRPGHVCTDE